MSAAPTSRSTAPDSRAPGHRSRFRGAPRRATHAACALAIALLLGVWSTLGASAAQAPTAKVHFACSKPNSATIPCYFSTPSHNIRCAWTPHSLNVTCVRVSSRRGFVLNPTGKAARVKRHLTHQGETLPMRQRIVFPQNLSCFDTKTSIVCNQDEGSGFFSIGPKGSHSR